MEQIWLFILLEEDLGKRILMFDQVLENGQIKSTRN
jgi:hypothetical protein